MVQQIKVVRIEGLESRRPFSKSFSINDVIRRISHEFCLLIGRQVQAIDENFLHEGTHILEVLFFHAGLNGSQRGRTAMAIGHFNQFGRPVENATFVIPERLNKDILRLDGVSYKALTAVYRARSVVHSIQI